MRKIQRATFKNPGKVIRIGDKPIQLRLNLGLIKMECKVKLTAQVRPKILRDGRWVRDWASFIA